MDTPEVIRSSIETIKQELNITSLFRDTPHYWVKASLPLAYSMACVEVVLQNSKEARAIYQLILEAWIEPDLLNLFKRFNELVPESEKERIKDALKNPEKEMYPDPEKPFRQIEDFYQDIDINEDVLNDYLEKLSPEEEKEIDSLLELDILLMEFILLGFNRDADIKNGKFRVKPSDNNQWLIWAVTLRSALESNQITLERLRQFYKLRKHKGKVVDFHEVLTNQPMSRWHRRMIASGKAIGARLKNDRIFMNAARAWYQCRIEYTSINKYCDDPKNNELDPENVRKKIKPCDDALGYIKRIPRK